MNKTAIKNFAIWARVNLIESAKQKAFEYEISEDGQNNSTLEVISGRVLSSTEKKQRSQLISEIKNKGFNQVMEEAAYTWFNRFIALRYMEVNGFLPSKVRVFSDEEGKFNPAILSEAMSVELDGLDREKVLELLDKQDNEALYKMLIIAQCNALSSGLPYMFEKIENWTELLFPSNLLKTDSVVGQMVTEIPEEDWQDAVQIIGWMYQYYNSELKDETFALLKKNVKITKERIPAATQLFTPDWIVRYMVENSLGKLWVEGHSNDELKKEWKYYLEEAEQEPQVEEELDKIRKEYKTIKPEEIKVIDPCMGSGHILVYAFDVLMQIYTSVGWSERDAAKSILENNIYGLDIDNRAGQLAYFAVMMKARKYNRRILNGEVVPNVMAIQDSSEIDSELIKFVANGDMKMQKELIDIKNIYLYSKEFGSLLSVPQIEYETILKRIEEIKAMDIIDIITGINKKNTVDILLPLIKQAQIMSLKYDAVITNPPYMSSGGMSGKLSDFVRDNYSDCKSDLFACFMEKGNHMLKKSGFNSMVTMQSWMFIPSFEDFRKRIIVSKDIVNLMHMETMVMGIAFGTAVSVFRNSYVETYKGTYNYIKQSDIVDEKPYEFPVMENRFCSISTSKFLKLPGCTIAYWNSQKFMDIFSQKSLGDDFDIKVGLQTGNNDQFLRYWFEVVRDDKKWVPHTKGGSYRKWYGNLEYVLNWGEDGSLVKNNKGAVIRSEKFYFKPGITWSHTTSGGFSGRLLPENMIINVESPTLFTDKYIFTLMSYLNSKVASKILESIDSTMHYKVGTVSKVPYTSEILKNESVYEYGMQNVEISMNDWNSFEFSWDFKYHPFIYYSKQISNVNLYDELLVDACEEICNQSPLAKSYLFWQRECNERFDKLKKNEEELNRIFINMYGLQDEMIAEIDEKDVTVRKADLQRDIKSFISYAVGCMSGRYSLDVEGLAYAGGTWDASKYISFIPDEDNIIPICDDEYFSDDIVGRFVEFVKVVYGEETLEENLKFIAEALGGKGTPREVIRTYFLKDFFNDHCKTYQKRPIYWLFDSGKKDGIKCLVYMHRYQPDTVARIRTDYIHELQSRYTTAIEDLERNIQSAETKDRVKMNKRLSHLKEQEIELRTYEEKIHLIADQMVDIDLDDGVKVNYAKFGDVLAKIK